jgi:hypothetical protein
VSGLTSALQLASASAAITSTVWGMHRKGIARRIVAQRDRAAKRCERAPRVREGRISSRRNSQSARHAPEDRT